MQLIYYCDFIQKYIYLGDKREPIIYIYNKTTMDYISSFRLREPGGITGGMTDMAMFAKDVQPPTNSKSLWSLKM